MRRLFEGDTYSSLITVINWELKSLLHVHLGQVVIAFRTLLHLGQNVITFRTLLHLGSFIIFRPSTAFVLSGLSIKQLSKHQLRIHCKSELTLI